jgi:hypothetical protein
LQLNSGSVSRRMRQHSRAVGTVQFVVAVAALTSCTLGPSWKDYRELLRAKAGEGAQDCGTVDLRQSRLPALACAQEALRVGTPFYVVFQVQGIDSRIFHGLASSASGDAAWVQWDSDAYGGGRWFASKPWVREEVCRRPTLSESGPPIECDS